MPVFGKAAARRTRRKRWPGIEVALALLLILAGLGSDRPTARYEDPARVEDETIATMMEFLDCMDMLGEGEWQMFDDEIMETQPNENRNESKARH